jgi:hypothetical protein
LFRSDFDEPAGVTVRRRHFDIQFDNVGGWQKHPNFLTLQLSKQVRCRRDRALTLLRFGGL